MDSITPLPKPIADLADSKERAQALDTHSSFIVQAPAGSGKTELLTQRYLALLARVEQGPEEILAITFTKKAAAEMRGRILAALAAGTTGPAQAALNRDRQQGWHLLANPNRLRIQTIDSFCAGLTRQMPLLSGLGSPPQTSEQAQLLYQQAAANLLESLSRDNPWQAQLATLIRHLGNHLPQSQQLIASLLAQRDQWLPHIVPLAQQTPEQLKSQLEQALVRVIQETLAQLKAAVPPAIGRQWLELADVAAQNLAAEGLDSPVAVCQGITQLPSTEVEDVTTWSGLASLLLTQSGDWRQAIDRRMGFPASSKVLTKEQLTIVRHYKDQLKALLTELADSTAGAQLQWHLQQLKSLPASSYSESQWQVLCALVSLLPVAAAELQLVFKAKGQVDFTEVMQRALKALGDPQAPSDLALALDYRIQHLLVDEFQDTSVSQFALLEKLTQGWQPGDGRTLFLVGDPMQSIYRFRQAQVGLFLRAWQQGVGDIYLQPLKLKVNFRSTQPLVDWVNRVFQQVLPASDDLASGAVSYSPAVAVNHKGPAEAVEYHPHADIKAQAEGICRLIQAKRQQNQNLRIAILVRARSHLPTILTALRRAGLAYQGVEIETLADRPLLTDLISLTKALMNLADRLHWLALLRGPYCGLSLADLLVVAGGESEEIIWDRLIRYCHITSHSGQPLTAEGQQRIARILPVLNHALGQYQRVPIRDWLEPVWQALGGPLLVEEQADLINAESYFNFIEQLEQRGELTTASWDISQLYAAADSQADERLQVMTIHKAKGLEFDVVIIPGLERSRGRDKPPLLAWTERIRQDQGADLLLAPRHANAGDKDANFHHLTTLEKQQIDYEQGRLLYVAATRAKQALHLFASPRVSQAKDGSLVVQPAANSFLKLLWPALQATDNLQSLTLNKQAENESPKAKPVPLRRLALTWQPASPEIQDRSDNPISSAAAAIHQWLDQSQDKTGQFIHQLLAAITEQGIDQWPADKLLAPYQPLWRQGLQQLGVSDQLLTAALSQVEQAIRCSLQDDRGRWLLDNRHQDSECEYEITLFRHNKVQRLRLDRTFIDQQGKRWIIDYKTSTPNAGQKLPNFLEQQQAEHRLQLMNYREAISKIEQRPTGLALYFPLLPYWLELKI
jgi:ATP-dependent exoDNAse (exonuclease V) beta subunit